MRTRGNCNTTRIQTCRSDLLISARRLPAAHPSSINRRHAPPAAVSPNSPENPNAHSGIILTDEVLLECERTDNTEQIERIFRADLKSPETAPFLRPGSWEAAEAGMRLLARGDAMSWLIAARYMQRGILCGQRPMDKTISAVFGSPAARWNASASKELLDLLLDSGLVSPSRLSIAYNVVVCGLAEQQQQPDDRGLSQAAEATPSSATPLMSDPSSSSSTSGLHTALQLLDRMFTLSVQGVDVYYETYTVLARRCQKLGLKDQAEAILQKRYASYHSSD